MTAQAWFSQFYTDERTHDVQSMVKTGRKVSQSDTRSLETGEVSESSELNGQIAFQRKEWTGHERGK